MHKVVFTLALLLLSNVYTQKYCYEYIPGKQIVFPTINNTNAVLTAEGSNFVFFLPGIPVMKNAMPPVLFSQPHSLKQIKLDDDKFSSGSSCYYEKDADFPTCPTQEYPNKRFTFKERVDENGCIVRDYKIVLSNDDIPDITAIKKVGNMYSFTPTPAWLVKDPRPVFNNYWTAAQIPYHFSGGWVNVYNTTENVATIFAAWSPSSDIYYLQSHLVVSLSTHAQDTLRDLRITQAGEQKFIEKLNLCYFGGCEYVAYGGPVTQVPVSGFIEITGEYCSNATQFIDEKSVPGFNCAEVFPFKINTTQKFQVIDKGDEKAIIVDKLHMRHSASVASFPITATGRFPVGNSPMYVIIMSQIFERAHYDVKSLSLRMFVNHMGAEELNLIAEEDYHIYLDATTVPGFDPAIAALNKVVAMIEFKTSEKLITVHRGGGLAVLNVTLAYESKDGNDMGAGAIATILTSDRSGSVPERDYKDITIIVLSSVLGSTLLLSLLAITAFCGVQVVNKCRKGDYKQIV